jgi:hypothetical protein
MVEAVKTIHLGSHLVRRYVEANFSVDTMVDHYIALYDTLLRPTLPIVKPTYGTEVPAAA